MKKLLKTLQGHPNRAIYICTKGYLIALSSPLSVEEFRKKYDLPRRYDYSQWNCTIVALARLLNEFSIVIEYNRREKPNGGYESIDGKSVLWFTPIAYL